MNNLQSLVSDIFTGGTLVRLRLLGPRTQHPDLPKRVEARPVQLRGQRMVQFAFQLAGRVTHRNVPAEEAIMLVGDLLEEQFKQAEIVTKDAEYSVLVNRRKQAAITRRTIAQPEPIELSHDRPKAHLLPEGEPCEFLHRLGVMTAEGSVIASKRDKFRQVNRFLEMVRDVTGELDKNRPVKIVDFGCGKSYLTFALYHYLRQVLGLDAHILGLDLKADVIEMCRQIAADLKYTHLQFRIGDIQGCSEGERADMVVCLHACDTATDDALAQAVAWETKVILAVPCCQKEVFRQIGNEEQQPLLKHGIVRERVAALVTDSARAQLLEIAGYSVQMLEFIEMEHTPKNLLIRAVRRPNPKRQQEARIEYERFRAYWNIAPSLQNQLPDTRS
jgi:SAM-dependent methyltransferase